MAFNCLKAAEPLLKDRLLFTTKSPGDPGTHLIDLRKMKVESTLEPLSETPGFEIQRFNH